MRYRFLVSHNALRTGFAIAAAFVIGGFLLAYLRLHDINQPIVIHFVPGEGIDMIGSNGYLIALLGLGTIIIAANAMIAESLWHRYPFQARVYAAATLFLGSLIFYIFLAILGAN